MNDPVQEARYGHAAPWVGSGRGKTSTFEIDGYCHCPAPVRVPCDKTRPRHPRAGLRAVPLYGSWSRVFARHYPSGTGDRARAGVAADMEMMLGRTRAS